MAPDVFSVVRGGYRAAKGWKKSDQDKFLGAGELSTLLSSARSDRRRYGADAWALFALASNFGLRQSEVLDLSFKDFSSLEMGYFRVRSLKKRAVQPDRLYVDPVHHKLCSDVLKGRSAVTKGEKLFPFSPRTARYLFGYYAAAAGISPNVSFHALRHTAARFMLQAIGGEFDYPERIINTFLRHAPSTTMIYLQPTPEDMIRAMKLKGVYR